MTDATLTRPKPRIDDAEGLDRVVHRIVEQVHPIAVYLFGSRATGEGDQDSDYDLMVVVQDQFLTDQPKASAIWAIGQSGRIDANALVTSESSFAWRRHEVGTLEYEVQLDGIRLYPAHGSDLRRAHAGAKTPAAMNVTVVEEWLHRVERDLAAARKCCQGDDAVPDQAAYHIQQAAEKLTKAALVAHRMRPRRGHKIEEFAKRLPAAFADRPRFIALGRFSKYVWVHRYPQAEEGPSEPEPAVTEVEAWIGELGVLKADFERWLAVAPRGSRQPGRT